MLMSLLNMTALILIASDGIFSLVCSGVKVIPFSLEKTLAVLLDDSIDVQLARVIDGLHYAISRNSDVVIENYQNNKHEICLTVKNLILWNTPGMLILHKRLSCKINRIISSSSTTSSRNLVIIKIVVDNTSATASPGAASSAYENDKIRMCSVKKTSKVLAPIILKFCSLLNQNLINKHILNG